MTVVSSDPEVDLSNEGLPIGPVLETAFREAVTDHSVVPVLEAEASPSGPGRPPRRCESPVATLFGWKPEELQSVTTLDLVHPADRVRAEAALPAIILQPGVPVALPPLPFRDHQASTARPEGLVAAGRR